MTGRLYRIRYTGRSHSRLHVISIREIREDMMVLVQQETVFAIEIREGVEARKKLLLFSFRQKISSHFCLCVKLKTCVTISRFKIF